MIPNLYLILLLTLFTSSLLLDACLEGHGISMTDDGDIQCLPCPAGMYSPTVDSICFCCPRTTYSTGPRSLNCLFCDPGYYSPECSTSCTPCKQGTYRPNIIGSDCTSCPTGAVCPYEGMIAFDLCQKGTYSALPGQTECRDCPEGTYNPFSGGTKCVPCNHGEYNDEKGQDACFSCPHNTYNTKMGSTSIKDCLDCPAGSYSDSTTDNVCEPCHKLCRTCYGPLSSQCEECNEEIGAALIMGMTICSCGAQSFYNEEENHCSPCHSYCDNCDGASNKDCIGCNTLHSYYVENEPSFCVSSCDDLQGYYLKDNTCRGSLLFNS